jgi:tetratricopeptide (TPR) repeat protein
MPARNGRCPCGSGKKYKQCCGQLPATGQVDIGQFEAMLKAGRYKDLEQATCDLVARQPTAGYGWKLLGMALTMQSKEALPALTRAAQLLPDDADAHGNLGIALLSAGRIEAAIASYRRALEIKPDYAEVWGRLASALLELGRPGEAAVCYRRVIELEPDLEEAHNGLGHAQLGLGLLDEAAASYRRALALKPNDADAHSSLAIVLRLQGQSSQAEASCRRALKIDPTSAYRIAILAEIRADIGQFAEAEDLFRRAILLQPGLVEAWVGIARLRRLTAADSAWLAEVQRFAAQPLRPRQLISLRYAIGKYFDDVQDFERAFLNYRLANELTKQHSPRYDRQKQTQVIDELAHYVDRTWVEQLRGHGISSARPLFVIGMPRSGTTLVEQILATHPDVFGAGELQFWSTAAARVLAYARHRPLTVGGLQKLGSDYLQLLQGLSAGASRVIDKMPANFMALGLIHAALPEARIIHMRRNPIDTCLSIYFQDFGATLSYANDLGDLAHYYAQYLRLMQHWSRVLPAETILDVPYEGLVEDQEAWSRRMLDFAGLPWEPKCLEFHRHTRSVVTSSNWQVRQRISRSSVGRWRNYEKHVAPLRQMLQSAQES